MRVFGCGCATIALLLAVGIALLGWLIYADRRFPTTPVVSDIAPGSSTSSIAAQLRAEGVVSSARLLSGYIRTRRFGGSIQAAEYDFPAHATITEIATILAGGGHPANVWITIPEGFTARQVARRLAAAGFGSVQTFDDIITHTRLSLDGTINKGLEGYLFPDTYLVPRHAKPTVLIGMMTQQFMRELPPQHALLARRLGFTVPQIVIIASMVEREAKVDAERAPMAGVYYNRLRIGMPLEVDATIEYALPQHKNALSFSDLRIDSPYNTYRYAGLPPTPIANPGRKSLLAAFHPAASDYLYYVYRGNGRHQFSRTLDEQRAAERKYLR
ncbi:MAG: endolytic transglycosylase MltG [Candidatus Eremiobacteraeota bacterium]|nr:endolytic transglycosylase MltG [Candidatus Eremiobacteraeota bacterium]